MIEIRFHGRGGQGGVVSAKMLAVSAIEEGRYALAFPTFGPERRGAPVVAYCRVDDRPILVRDPITNPDVVVVLDPTLLRSSKVDAGLKPGGKLVLNTCIPPEKLSETYGFDGCLLAAVDANEIAMRIIGSAITNTAMLGALLRVEPVARLESVLGQIRERFPSLAEKNARALEDAYEKTRTLDLVGSKGSS